MIEGDCRERAEEPLHGGAAPVVSADAGQDDSAADRESAIALAMLRRSVQSRCTQARIAFIAMLLNTTFSVLLMGRGLDSVAIAIWLTSSTILLSLRYRLAVRARRELDGPREVLARVDRRFRLLSIASQTITGSGIWIVLGSDDAVAAYMMTLLVSLYGAGAMINLAHDFRSLRVSLPLLMSQTVIYWFIQGGEGIAVAVILTGLTLMILSSGRNSQRVFEDSVRIRFEKDELVAELDEERRTAIGALALAEEANRSRAFFVAAASHDLRQPLYAATLLNHALSMHALPPSAIRLLEQQGRALATSSALFDDLLDLSRFESGTIAPVIASVNVGELAQQLEEEIRPQCQKKGLALRVECTPCTVSSDYDLLIRLIRNLMSNAVRYTEHGHVLLRVERDGSQALVTVEDTGPGIAPADQKRIYEPPPSFAQPWRTRDQGVGLGLAIVRRIALLLAHELSVDSGPERGTQMKVRMALVPEAARATPAVDEVRAAQDPAHAG